MPYKNLKPKEFKAAMDTHQGSVLLDVRTPREVAESSIEGAIAIDFLARDFDQKVKGLDKEVAYYIYCRSGQRSGQACLTMAQLGFKQLSNLEGGILAWNKQ
ncbi:MAG: rhodanese-like domain-containing protein [Aureispira sp.]